MANKRELLDLTVALEGGLWCFTASDGPGTRNPHTHRELEVNVVMQGEAHYVVREAHYELGPGTLIWLFPDQAHVLGECSAEFRMWIGVFRPRLVKRLCRDRASVLTAEDPGRVLVGTVRPAALRHLDSVFTEIEQAENDPARFNAGLGYSLRSAWSAYEEAEQDLVSERLHPAVARVIALFDSTPLDRPLPELARQSGLSYSRLSRVFKNQTGQSLPAFRDRMRVKRFCECFRAAPQRTMLDCALEAGFGSYAQFYRVFKQHMGQGPAAFRRGVARSG